MSSRKLITAIMLSSTLLFSAQPALAQTTLTPNTKIRINLDTSFSLNVRRTPGGEKIGTQQGQSTGCVEETQGDWAKINYDPPTGGGEDGLPA